MTGLLFVLQPQEVTIAMDTLATSAVDKLPFKYCSKILPLPHLSAAVCGTGAQRLVLDWYLDIQANVLANGVDFINQVAPERLREISTGLGLTGDSTVYHFGWSADLAAFTGMAFRAKNDFVPEPVPYGIGIKPPFDELISIAPDAIEQRQLEGIAEILVRMRQIDDALPLEERVGIGGEVHVLMMNEALQLTHVVSRWLDCEQQFELMLTRMQTAAGGA